MEQRRSLLSSFILSDSMVVSTSPAKKLHKTTCEHRSATLARRKPARMKEHNNVQVAAFKRLRRPPLLTPALDRKSACTKKACQIACASKSGSFHDVTRLVLLGRADAAIGTQWPSRLLQQQRHPASQSSPTPSFFQASASACMAACASASSSSHMQAAYSAAASLGEPSSKSAGRKPGVSTQLCWKAPQGMRPLNMRPAWAWTRTRTHRRPFMPMGRSGRSGGISNPAGGLGPPSTEVGLRPPGLQRCMAQALSDARGATSPQLPNESAYLPSALLSHYSTSLKS